MGLASHVPLPAGPAFPSAFSVAFCPAFVQLHKSFSQLLDTLINTGTVTFTKSKKNYTVTMPQQLPDVRAEWGPLAGRQAPRQQTRRSLDCVAPQFQGASAAADSSGAAQQPNGQFVVELSRVQVPEPTTAKGRNFWKGACLGMLQAHRQRRTSACAFAACPLFFPPHTPFLRVPVILACCGRPFRNLQA